ncbi:hypothetical protein [Ralstonia pickettii]|uniref:hypothetical protein n=1 Tax=Ralstonia pickettii TaxID=329 RepID=UPI0015FD3853|nr:hypothetical protein [Ralstonia pickettii]MBB0023661.1 hypothetical protein [Ralstonia pickettii]MBB0096980.1 hypothetical protein [Ralstonia pickettii]MBB0107050.1 hypothetical protein [Ralstonia pickettii]MBB0127753.1 hypothetical protein [Ralstonia pickettii]MBB0160750.1 hypothetical protein [Ralstonia pickettii]
MAYLIEKRGKFMTGSGYSTAYGYRFSWSHDEEQAQRFADDDPSVDVFASRTHGKIVHRPNTRKEWKAIAKRAA